jgi:myo-inositol-1(or 4)-monophosphatase
LGTTNAATTSRAAFLHLAYHTATAAALAGGRAARQACLTPLETAHKGRHDLVTNGDLAAERAVVDVIRAAFPDHGLLSEEGPSGGTGGEDGGYRWVVDPVDGTTNYSRGLPFYSVSVALMEGDEYLVGAVYDPVRDEMFSAWKGGGAFLNGQPIQAGQADSLDDCVFSFGLSYSSEERAKVMEVSRHMAPLCLTARELGSAALALAYIACGRMDCYLHAHLMPWDAAAGKVILEEAGGLMTDLEGRPWTFATTATLAAGPRIHAVLLEQIRGIYRAR